MTTDECRFLVHPHAFLLQFIRDSCRCRDVEGKCEGNFHLFSFYFLILKTKVRMKIYLHRVFYTFKTNMSTTAQTSLDSCLLNFKFLYFIFPQLSNTTFSFFLDLLDISFGKYPSQKDQTITSSR